MLEQTQIDDLVSKLVPVGGSDLYLKVEAPPVVRMRGLLKYLEGYEVLRPVRHREPRQGYHVGEAL